MGTRDLPDEDQLLWDVRGKTGQVRCIMVSCCTGAELQLLCDDEILLRELYPDKSSLYERARALKTEFESAS